jgi:hypothetical protein
MRAPVTEPRLRALMRALAGEAREAGRIYLRDLFALAEPQLYRYPAIHPPALRAAVYSLAR